MQRGCERIDFVKLGDFYARALADDGFFIFVHLVFEEILCIIIEDLLMGK